MELGREALALQSWSLEDIAHSAGSVPAKEPSWAVGAGAGRLRGTGGAFPGSRYLFAVIPTEQNGSSWSLLLTLDCARRSCQVSTPFVGTGWRGAVGGKGQTRGTQHPSCCSRAGREG